MENSRTARRRSLLYLELAGIGLAIVLALWAGYALRGPSAPPPADPGHEHVEQEDQVAGRPLLAVDLHSLQADADQPVTGLPRAAGHLDVCSEGNVVLRAGVVVVEVVDQLLDPDRVRRREPPFSEQEPPHVGVGGRVDVDREREKRLILYSAEGVFDKAVVLVAISACRSAVAAVMPLECVVWLKRGQKK